MKTRMLGIGFVTLSAILVAQTQLLPAQVSGSGVMLTDADTAGTAGSVATQQNAVDPDALQLQAGDILEILPIHRLQSATYAWILTQDRKFIQAGRDRSFAARLVNPGAYTLTAEIASQDKTTRIRKTFSVTVSARTPGMEEASTPITGSGTTLVQTDPLLDAAGNAVMKEDSSIIRILPVGNLRPLNIDTDTATDSDGDGKTDNDVDNLGTLSQTDATPIVLWFTAPVTSASLAISALQGNGTYATQHIRVLDFASGKQGNLVEGDVAIQAAKIDDRTMQFSVAFGGNTKPDAPLLYRWNFGDGSADSLETQPTHTFGTGSTFAVSVSIRNLLTAKDVATATQTVSLDIAIASSSASSASSATSTAPSSSAASSASSVATGSGGSLLSSLSGFLPLLGAFALAMIIGVAAVLFLGRRKKNSDGTSNTALEKHFEQMEIKLMEKQHGATVVPATVTTPPPAVAEKELERSSTPVPAPEPQIDPNKAPSWLKQGLQGKPDLSKPAPTPAPVVASPAPKPAAPATPAPAAAPAKVPTPVPATPPAAAAKPPVVTPAPVTPKPQPTPAAKPAPVPAPAPATVTAAMPPAPAPKMATPVTAPPATPQKPATPAVPAAPKTPAAPKPVMAPTATPAPSAPAPVAAAVTPAPATAAPASIATTPAATVPPVAAAPVVTPAPKSAITPPVSPAPIAPPMTPAPAATTATAPAAPAPAAAPAPKDDPTVAYIRVEGIQQPPQNTDQKA